MNIEVQCGKCRNWVKVHAKSLRWIRCPSCHNRVWLDSARKRSAFEPVIANISTPVRMRGRYNENW